MTTPYRNDLDALQETKTTLETELASTKAREAELARELASVKERIEAKKRLPMLDQVRVASPCNASWDEMLGDDRVRFCTSCEKNVFNLSAMSREDAEGLIQERVGGELCVRFYQRADGTIMTQDCPVGVGKKRRKMAVLAAAGAGAMALAVTSLFTKTMGKPVVGATMGEMEVQPPAPHVMGSIAPPVDTVPPVAPETQTPHVSPPQANPPAHPPIRMGRMVRAPNAR